MTSLPFPYAMSANPDTKSLWNDGVQFEAVEPSLLNIVMVERPNLSTRASFCTELPIFTGYP